MPGGPLPRGLQQGTCLVSQATLSARRWHAVNSPVHHSLPTHTPLDHVQTAMVPKHRSMEGVFSFHWSTAG